MSSDSFYYLIHNMSIFSHATPELKTNQAMIILYRGLRMIGVDHGSSPTYIGCHRSAEIKSVRLAIRVTTIILNGISFHIVLHFLQRDIVGRSSQ